MTAAWDLIGYQGSVRVKGGRTLYEAVLYCDDTPGTHVRLVRLETGDDGLRQINRYVAPDTELEVLSDQARLEEEGFTPADARELLCSDEWMRER